MPLKKVQKSRQPRRITLGCHLLLPGQERDRTAQPIRQRWCGAHTMPVHALELRCQLARNPRRKHGLADPAQAQKGHQARAIVEYPLREQLPLLDATQEPERFRGIVPILQSLRCGAWCRRQFGGVALIVAWRLLPWCCTRVHELREPARVERGPLTRRLVFCRCPQCRSLCCLTSDSESIQVEIPRNERLQGLCVRKTVTCFPGLHRTHPNPQLQCELPLSQRRAPTQT